ncbi:hypothetical protein C8J56DRAFT_990812 [Mycena floridula]|nr:hypothetical protein C8J56DRAFT_990812 [Mycena floridula]
MRADWRHRSNRKKSEKTTTKRPERRSRSLVACLVMAVHVFEIPSFRLPSSGMHFPRNLSSMQLAIWLGSSGLLDSVRNERVNAIQFDQLLSSDLAIHMSTSLGEENICPSSRTRMYPVDPHRQLGGLPCSRLSNWVSFEVKASCFEPELASLT